MKKHIILGMIILLLITQVTIAYIVYKNVQNSKYDRIYLNSLSFDGRLAEYKFIPNKTDGKSGKITFKLKDKLKENAKLSLYKIEKGKELNIQLDENLQSEILENPNQLDLKLVIYLDKSYELLDKDYIDIGFLSINNAN